MSKYTPLPPPQEAESVPLYLQNELQKISQATDTDEFEITGELLVNKISCRPEGHIYGRQQLVLNAGETADIAGTQEDEIVYINSESGLQINSSPDNWGSGWAGRDTLRITGQGIMFGGSVDSGGTTSSSNTLDDYEEGTWTPVIYGSTGGTGSGNIVNAKYTKVGGLVQVMCYLNSYDVTGLSGAVRLSGLPFSSNGYHISVIGYCNMFSTDEASVSVSGYTESGSTNIYLMKGSSTTPIPASEATNSGGQLMLNFTYATTS